MNAKTRIRIDNRNGRTKFILFEQLIRIVRISGKQLCQRRCGNGNNA